MPRTPEQKQLNPLGEVKPKPSEQIISNAKSRPTGLDPVTIGGAGISSIILEILHYLDKHENGT